MGELVFMMRLGTLDDVYYTRGSHGCINLPLKVAAELYDMVKVNTPVVCYY